MDDVVDRAEAERWRNLVAVFRRLLPELETWWRDSNEDLSTASPGALWTQLCLDLLDTDNAPRPERLDVWPRVLGLIEVVEEAAARVRRIKGNGSDDAILLYAFADAGIIHEICVNAAGLNTLLPLMGPLTVRAAREKDSYVRHRRRSEAAINWMAAGSKFRSLDVQPDEILPADLRNA